MQQHLMQMQPMMAAFDPNSITTDIIQQYLDENKSLILQILDNQNAGKLGECAQNQIKLQQNLMYLAAIADSQPQPPPMHSQFPPNAAMQLGARYLQHQQAQQMTPQSLMAARSSMLYAQQPLSTLQQQALHSQLGMSSGASNGLHMLHSETGLGGNSSMLAARGFPNFGRSTGEGLQAANRGMAGAGKQDAVGVGSTAGNAGGQSRDGTEPFYLKGSEGEAN
ncbi:GRF1-interacting factor 1-like [Magnolia sinica]|uniref:GRF1-interacting factor 1-like n=1 Tax=Magnolia sinica TaxID=86752 RepID=UPI00265A0BF3|nr:GRF1-interacting factor 1-like [Magnolia sinica]